MLSVIDMTPDAVWVFGCDRIGDSPPVVRTLRSFAAAGLRRAPRGLAARPEDISAKPPGTIDTNRNGSWSMTSPQWRRG